MTIREYTRWRSESVKCRDSMRATFSSAFLRGEERAVRFLPADFRDPAARRQAAERAARRPQPVSPELLAALREQEQTLSPSAARKANLEALAQPGTAVVVTGQQVGLFLGPLYTFYKAASAIAFARQLQAETGVRCVPLFWLQTEDHDFEEIRRCHSPAPDGTSLELALEPGGSDESQTRISVAHRRLGSEITGQLEALEEALGRLPHAGPMLALLREHYRPGQSLGLAFAGVLSALFADEGLLFLNPRCAAIAKLAAPIYRRSIVEADQIAAVLQARSAALCAVGFDEQVAVRPGTTLVFFHDSVDGPRYRLERSRDQWTTPHARSGGAGEPLSNEELLAILDRQPLRFSTSALLRPIVQDTLLPTAAYVGGPGELNYFAQLQPLYELFGVAQPLAVLRARFRCIEENTQALLRKLGLHASDAELPRAELLRRLSAQLLDKVAEMACDGAPLAPEAVRAWLLDEVEQRLTQLGEKQSGLRDAVQRTRVSIERNVNRLVGRYERILLERDQTLSERVDRLQHALLPAGVPQERHYALPYFIGKYGIQGFKQQVLGSLEATGLATAGVRELEL